MFIKYITLILSFILFVTFGVLLGISFKKTPANLKGYYGLFYWLFTIVGFIAAIWLFIISII